MDRLAETTLSPLHLSPRIATVMEYLWYQLWTLSLWRSFLYPILRNWSFMISRAQYCLLLSYSFSQELWWRSRLEAVTEYGFITETKVLTSMNTFRQLWVLEAFEICFNNFFYFWNLFKGPFLLLSIIAEIGKARFPQYSLWLCWKIDILMRNNLGISCIFPYSKSTEK